MDSAKIDGDSSYEINLGALLDILLQYVWVIISVFVVIFAIGVGYVTFATPIYRADALIQVEDNKPSMLSGIQNIANALGTSSNPVTGEIEILLSREVLFKAISGIQADIQIRPKFFPVVGAWYARVFGKNPADSTAPFNLNEYAWGKERLRLDSLEFSDGSAGEVFYFRARENGFDIEDETGKVLTSGQVGRLFEFKADNATVKGSVSLLNARPGVVFQVQKVSPVKAYKAISSRLKIEEATRQSGIIRVSYEDSDADFAQRLVNAISKAYLLQNVERRSAEADQSLKFLNTQMPEIKKSVEQAEDALTTFRTKTNTVRVEKEADGLLARSIDVERGRLELQLKLDEMRQRFKPDHPQIKALESQIEETKREGGRVNEQVNRLPAAQRDLLRLERDATVNSELYIALLNNVQQLKVAKAGTIGNVRVVDYAIKDDVPVAPQKSLVLAIAAFAGIVLGVIAAVVARLLRPTVRDAAEVERATGLISYASVPESISQEKLDSHLRDKRGRKAIVEGRNQLLALVAPEDPAIESLRSLRTGLAFALMGAGNKNVVITGPTAGLGKSFISANLSALLAASGKKILLVETDMRRPQLGTYFGYKEKRGLAEILVGAQRFDDVVYKVDVLDGNLDVLPAGSIPPNPGELLLNERFTELVRSIQDRYDYLIFDSAPVLPVGDTLAVTRIADAVFMVVRSECSTFGEVRDAVSKLESVGSSVKGMIFNGVKRRRIGYGYAYRYYYSYGRD